MTAPKGRLIYDEGDAPAAFYRVEAGCVRLQMNGGDGRRQILAFCLPGDVFGVELNGSRRVAAEAAAASELMRFPLNANLGRSLDPRSFIELLAAVSDMVATLSTHLAGLGHASAEDRLMWFLDWLAGRQGVALDGGAVRTPMSRRDIADFLSLAPETLSRTFARLHARGLIHVADRTVTLRPAPLRNAA